MTRDQDKIPPTEDRPVVIGIEIVTRRRYAIHARSEESVLEMIRLFEHDHNPTIINGRSTSSGSGGGASAHALDRPRSSIERISLESEDTPVNETEGDPIQDLIDNFGDLTSGQKREVLYRILGYTDDGAP